MQKVFISFIFFCVITDGFSQTKPSDAGTDQFLDKIIKVPVLEGGTNGENISPNGQKLCFDKVIKVGQQTTRGYTEMCLFINTKIGLMASSPVIRGGVGTCDIKPERADFSLFVLGLKGNAYHYFNSKKQQTIDHWVVTGNSESKLFRFTMGIDNTPLHKKDETRSFCDDKVKAYLYKADGRTESWYLFGKTYPDKVFMTDRKYLGNYGVGFQFTENGMFIIMQVEGNGLNSKIIDIRDIEICFDPAGFKLYESEMYTKKMESLQRERQNLEREARRAIGQPCETLELERISFQKEGLNRMEENLQLSTEQNIYQSSPAIQKARVNSLINYNEVVQASIFETKVKICRTEQQLSRSTTSSRQRYEDRLKCLSRHLGTQHQVLEQMKHIDQQYHHEPGKAFQEKAKISMRALVGCD